MDVNDLKAAFEVPSYERSRTFSGEKTVIIPALSPELSEINPAGMKAVRCDSRRVRPGDVFVAVRGTQVDGHEFIPQAVQRGAAVVVAERAVKVPKGVQLVRVTNSAAALGELAQAAAGFPCGALQVLGVTGTNGKTTVAYLVRAILNSAGLGCGMIGTVEYDLGGGGVVPADNTTPGAPGVADLMRRMVERGTRAVVIECSSHGLDQDRLAGVRYAAAAFTNLSGDHLDYHKTPDAYLEAKSKLFRGLGEGAVAVLNGQDPAGEALAEVTPAGTVWRYSIEGAGEIVGHIETMDMDGCEFTLSMESEVLPIKTGLVGEHNVSNCLAAAGLCRALGVDGETIRRSLEAFGGVPGRLERVDEGRRGMAVMVDYAHTDDALNHVLETLGKLTDGRLIVVFGCGGQRDQTKRPRMAQVAEKWADLIVVTNDNPRQEDPQQILAQIRAGFSPMGHRKMREIPDRREAIYHAVRCARQGDVVLIAGKGHEDYQIVGSEKRRFDDRDVAREFLSRRD